MKIYILLGLLCLLAVTNEGFSASVAGVGYAQKEALSEEFKAEESSSYEESSSEYSSFQEESSSSSSSEAEIAAAGYSSEQGALDSGNAGTAAASVAAASKYGSESKYAAKKASSSSSSSSSYSKKQSVSSEQSVSSQRAVAAISYQEQWPDLYQIDAFKNICQLGSGYKSARLTPSAIGLKEKNFDYDNLFATLYAKNDFFKKYIYSVTGIQTEKECERRKFFSIVRENPRQLLRSVHLFARHPTIFKSQLAQIALKSSDEILRSTSSTTYKFTQYEENFKTVLQSKTYRKIFATVFQTEDESALLSSIRSAFTRNSAGTLLLLRHVLTRRKLLSANDYIGVNYKAYRSSSSLWSKKSWRHNEYYSRYQSYQSKTESKSSSISNVSAENASAAYSGVRSSSLSESESQSVKQTSAKSAVESVGAASSAKLSSGAYAKRSVVETTTTTTTTTKTVEYEEHWPQLYQEKLFKDVCNLESTYKSRQISRTLIEQQGQSYDFQSAFSQLYTKNTCFRNYVVAATGIRVDEADYNTKFYGLVKESPGTLLKLVGLFARHPLIFKNQIADFVISKTSSEILQSSSSFKSEFFEESYVTTLAQSKTYRSQFASVFGCGADEAVIKTRLLESYKRNSAGTLLLLRHILTRRTTYAFDDYMAVNLNVYRSKKNIWGRRSWRHNEYFSKFFSLSKATTNKRCGGKRRGRRGGVLGAILG